jgi:hypothetical protein
MRATPPFSLEKRATLDRVIGFDYTNHVIRFEFDANVGHPIAGRETFIADRLTSKPDAV